MSIVRRIGLAALAALGLVTSGARQAEASPSFARKYNVSCHTCHDTVYPELNAWGRRFQENGYQYPAGAEEERRDRDTQTPGTIDERLGLLRSLPLAVRATGLIQVPVSASESGRNSVDLRAIDNLYVIGGGSIFKNVSVFFSASLAPSAMLHHAAVGFHNIFGDGYLNLRVGNLLLLGFLHPEHRTITKLGNLAATTRVGLNPTSLDNSHLGIELYGRFFKRRLFYQLAVIQGAQGLNGISDLDSGKDFFGQLQLHLRELYSVGVLGYYGRTQITNTAALVTQRFTDPFFIVGGDVELRFGPVFFFGYALYGRHENPTGASAPISYVGARGDLRWAIRRDLLAGVRYDGIFSHDDHALERQVATANLTFLFLTNLKLFAEFQAELSNFHNSTAYFALDVAL